MTPPPVRTITPMTIEAATEEHRALARLLCLASPAFPTGGFAYSHGLEWAVEAGDIRDAGGLLDWLAALLTHGSGRADAILLCHAHHAWDRPDMLAGLAELAAASSPGLERRAETLNQGAAFAASCLAWGCDVPPSAYPVVFGAAAGAQGIGQEAACIGFLTAWTGNLVSAGVRLVPLGQSDGLRVLAGLEDTLLQVVHAARTATLDELGTACFRADLACLQHETQYSRMFRS